MAALSVRQLTALLANADPNAMVVLGVNDDEANLAGGVFVHAEEVVASDPGDRGHPYVQINAWTDLREELGERA